MSDSTLARTLLTVGIVVLMVPGLIIEPGPISEIIGLTAILAVWGYEDVLPGGSA